MNILKLTLLTALAGAALCATAMPSDARCCNGTFRQNHPRRAEVVGRDRSLNRQLQADKGRLGGNYGSLEGEDKSIHRQEQADARANGGYITKAQKSQLNQEENGLRGQMNQDYRNSAQPGSFAYNHPRRAQVLGQDNQLNNQLAQDRGQLGGNYGRLERDDQSIRNQEQRDAARNGGFITPGQEGSLDQRESNLQSMINNDFK